VPDVSGAKGRAARDKPVGGLVSAIRPALDERGGIWFGWSGNAVSSQTRTTVKSTLQGNINYLTIDLSEYEVDNYYTGFSNRTLWPLLHSFPTRVRLRDEEHKSYHRINRKFAKALFPYLEKGDIVWIQDYHLIPLGESLRHLGWDGPIGFFLHTPFPPPDIFLILPWARKMLETFLTYDLIGFHVEQFRHNFEQSLLMELEGELQDHCFRYGSIRLKIGVYPIGIDAEMFQRWAVSPKADKQARTLKRFIGDRRLILGVDRLDYTKGIMERLRTFERMLDRFPSWKRRVSMIQISAPSRTRIPEYINQKRDVDRLVGEINGRQGEADWTPISYLYRSYDQEMLAGFYRIADVCLVSPLRDGMNLVSKEFVASQTDNPGVLVLSRFCGAADDLREALIINPYDRDGSALALKRALEMPIDERRRRQAALMEKIQKSSSKIWRDNFLGDLAAREYGLFGDSGFSALVRSDLGESSQEKDLPGSREIGPGE
jgi:trehalose 6-phosphate synthase